MSDKGTVRRSERGWWVGLACGLCGARVKADNGRFSQPVTPDGTFGEPWAEHHPGDCRSVPRLRRPAGAGQR
jgi:hypothetical protein